MSEKVRERRMRLAGHCTRHPKLSANLLILWEPTQGRAIVSRGRSKATYISALKNDTRLNNIQELRTAMIDRSVWRSFMHGALSWRRLRPKHVLDLVVALLKYSLTFLIIMGKCIAKTINLSALCTGEMQSFSYNLGQNKVQKVQQSFLSCKKCHVRALSVRV